MQEGPRQQAGCGSGAAGGAESGVTTCGLGPPAPSRLFICQLNLRGSFFGGLQGTLDRLESGSQLSWRAQSSTHA